MRACGGGKPDVQLTDEEKAEIEAAKVNFVYIKSVLLIIIQAAYNPVEAIEEDPQWNLAANVLAVICVCVCVFLHGFFA